MTSLCENSKKVFVKTVTEERRVEIKFKYVDPNLGLDRFFTLRRHYTDSIDVVKTRILTNIEKASLKYRKKLKKKLKCDDDGFRVDIEILHNQTVLDSSVILEQILELDNIYLSVNSQIFQFYLNPILSVLAQ